MALVQVWKDGELVFERTVEEIMHMFWDSWEELDGVGQNAATIEVVPE